MTIRQGIIYGTIGGLVAAIFFFAGIVIGAATWGMVRDRCVPSITEICGLKD